MNQVAHQYHRDWTIGLPKGRAVVHLVIKHLSLKKNVIWIHQIEVTFKGKVYGNGRVPGGHRGLQIRSTPITSQGRWIRFPHVPAKSYQVIEKTPDSD